MCGSLACLRRPRVAIVGTRSASAAGLAFARTLAAELAEAGVSIVSGLARGIDGAAHRGALSRPGTESSGPVGVLGTGVGVAYPREHRSLQHEVSLRGLLLSEYEPTRGPRPEAFPQRNRIVAQLAQVVVVVESGAGGGSLITVNEAGLRHRPVLAVPSNPLVRSGAGTNDLLRGHGDDGPLALPCHGVADVLALLDVQRADGEWFVDDRATPNPSQLSVLEAIGWDRRSTSSLADELSQPLIMVVRSLNELESLGWVHHVDGRWVRKPS